MKLTDEQKTIIKKIIKFEKPIQTLGGYAGAGKSTVIKHLVELLPDFAVCAYTGKAANVLRKKQIPAKTIHSLIYKAIEEEGKVYFALANHIECSGIIVDEASMVSREIYEHLISFRKPIIFVGDHGQLEPIGDKFNLMENPDFRLETIHRNAGEIAHFAEHIRKGYKPSSWEIRNGCGEKVKFVSKYNYKELLVDVDQIICAYNKLRAETNHLVRKKLDRKNDQPEPNDKVMCLRNNSMMGLFNGMQGLVKSIFKKNNFIFESDNCQYHVFFDPKVFNQVKYEFDHNRDAPEPFDYSYAITCHKAQGDQFYKILVLEQKCDLWDHKRWAYTAASRAINKIYWCEL